MNLLTEENVFERFQTWAQGASDVRAAVLTGSRVNPKATIDHFSDYDIELYVEDLAPYRNGDAWLDSLGTVLVKCPWRPASYEKGWITRMAVFKEGFRIDFQITDGELATKNYVDGFRVLLDRENLTTDLTSPTYDSYLVKKPTEEDWDKFVHEFWWDAIYVAKELARDELFYAKYTFDFVLRFDYMQRLIEWTICVEHGWDSQPNKFGRYFRKFIDHRRWARVESTFADASISANWTALFATLDLFRELAHEVAGYLNYSYPETLDSDVTSYLSDIRQIRL